MFTRNFFSFHIVDNLLPLKKKNSKIPTGKLIAIHCSPIQAYSVKIQSNKYDSVPHEDLCLHFTLTSCSPILIISGLREDFFTPLYFIITLK